MSDAFEIAVASAGQWAMGPPGPAGWGGAW